MICAWFVSHRMIRILDTAVKVETARSETVQFAYKEENIFSFLNNKLVLAVWGAVSLVAEFNITGHDVLGSLPLYIPSF